jgi:5-methylcytosine-specific restriction endonuclease McrA
MADAKPSAVTEPAWTTSTAHSSTIPLQTRPVPPAQARIEPPSPNRFGVHFTADAEFRDLLEEVRALARHQLPQGELLPVMKRALEACRRELRNKRLAVGVKPRSNKPRVAEPRADAVSVSASAAPSHGKRARRVSAAVRREVYVRDNGCCTFISDNGRRCGTQQFLELDHVQPWARGGESTVDNLRLRCRAHNQHSARARFGSAHMRAAVDRARKKNREKRDVLRDAEASVQGRDDNYRDSVPKALNDAEGCDDGGAFCDHQIKPLTGRGDFEPSTSVAPNSRTTKTDEIATLAPRRTLVGVRAFPLCVPMI